MEWIHSFPPFQVKGLAVNLHSLGLFLNIQHPSFDRTEYILSQCKQPSKAKRAVTLGIMLFHLLEFFFNAYASPGDVVRFQWFAQSMTESFPISTVF